MTTTSSAASTATAADVVSTTDERLARLSARQRLLVRPEFGALAGAFVVWLLAGASLTAGLGGEGDVRDERVA